MPIGYVSGGVEGSLGRNGFRQRKHVHGDQRESQQQGVDVVGCVAGVCPVADGRVATEARRGEAVVDVAGADAETRRKPRLPHSLVASTLRFIGGRK